MNKVVTVVEEAMWTLVSNECERQYVCVRVREKSMQCRKGCNRGNSLLGSREAENCCTHLNNQTEGSTERAKRVSNVRNSSRIEDVYTVRDVTVLLDITKYDHKQWRESVSETQ